MAQAPVHMSHGDRVVYMVASRYVAAGSRPAFSKADISAYASKVRPQRGNHAFRLNHSTYMQRSTALLNSEIVTAAEDLAIR